MDQFLLDHTRGPTIPVAPALIHGRAAIGDLAARLLALDDAVLDRRWRWRADDPGTQQADTEIRYGFYRVYEVLEAATGEVTRTRIASGAVPAPATPLAAAATAARWDLHGLLAGLADEDLDRDPGRGEWSVRKTLAHIVGSQRSYAWFTAWWLTRAERPIDDFPPRAPDDLVAQLPDDTYEGEGTLAAIRARLDEILDDSAGRLGVLDDRALRVRARWSRYPVTVGFRIGRWASHLREHTVQVEKTLAMLEREPREVERLVRLVMAAWGRLEATAFIVDLADSVATTIDKAVAEAEDAVDEVARAVGAEGAGPARA